jgi:Protein of unknown function (DUF1304)
VAIAALVFAALAALVHVYIWVLESLLWTAPRTRAVFGTSEEEAATTKLLALNQASTTCSWLAFRHLLGVRVGIACPHFNHTLPTLSRECRRSSVTATASRSSSNRSA